MIVATMGSGARDDQSARGTLSVNATRDAPPVSIDKCYDVVEFEIGAIADAGARPIVISSMADEAMSRISKSLLCRDQKPLRL